MTAWTTMEAPLVCMLPNSTTLPLPGIWNSSPGVSSTNSTTAITTGPQSAMATLQKNKHSPQIEREKGRMRASFLLEMGMGRAVAGFRREEKRREAMVAGGGFELVNGTLMRQLRRFWCFTWTDQDVPFFSFYVFYYYYYFTKLHNFYLYLFKKFNIIFSFYKRFEISF